MGQVNQMTNNNQRKVLLGLHDNVILNMYDSIARRKSIHPVTMSERESLLGELKREEYDLCIIDPNLGNPGARDISFARDVRASIESSGYKTSLYVMTGREDNYADLVNEGFRAGLKAHFPVMEPFEGM